MSAHGHRQWKGKAVPPGFKSVLAVNVVFVCLVALVAFTLGDQVKSAAVFYPDEAVPQAHAIHPPADKNAAPRAPVRYEARLEVPSEYRSVDAPAPWSVQPDGSVKLKDTAL